MWNVTDVQEKGVHFNPLNVKSVYFGRSLKRVWGGAQIYSQRWYSGNILSGPSGLESY